MADIENLSELVAAVYEKSDQEFGRWMWRNHVPFVAEKTQELAQRFGADQNIAVAGAWLHDLGDALVHRHAAEHDAVTRREATRVMEQAGYSQAEIERVFSEVIEVHSCRDGKLPTTVEGKVMATADALVHFETDFYLQFTWMHLPEGKSYKEFLAWVQDKLERDFNDKIFFDEVREAMRPKYEALKEVFFHE